MLDRFPPDDTDDAAQGNANVSVLAFRDTDA
jgi:hypothetical protein